MKKLLFFIVSVITLISCSSKKGDLYDEEMAKNFKVSQYNKGFEQKFGKISPTHTWGFGNNLNSRTTVKEKHEWKSRNLIVPTDVTQEEIDNVKSWLQENKNPKKSISLDWKYFWLQQVSYTELGRQYLNYFKVGNDEHVNDFNHAVGKTVFMENSSTSNFTTHCSFNSKTCDNYVIIEIDNNYYICFEVNEYKDSGEHVGGDGVYDDWVIKVIPASSARIIAEDLGSYDDFDFNDVVFDVAYLNNKTIITIQAAGGTLPLKVQGKEVHELFGVDVKTMVNTGIGNTLSPLMFEIDGVIQLNDIEISVLDAKANEYVLKSECGKAPQKICIQNGHYQWTSERQSIEDKYPNFKYWVGNEEINWLQ